MHEAVCSSIKSNKVKCEMKACETSGAFLVKVLLKMAETSIFWPSSQEELAKLRPISIVDITLNQNHRDLTQNLPT